VQDYIDEKETETSLSIPDDLRFPGPPCPSFLQTVYNPHPAIDIDNRTTGFSEIKK